MNISEIHEIFKTLKKPLNAEQIEDSEAFSFLNKSIKNSNDKILISNIFTLLLAELIEFENKTEYFEYVLKILRSNNYDIDQLSAFLFSISLSKNPKKISKTYFYFILSITIPKIFSEIYSDNNIYAFSIYMRVMSSIIQFKEKEILNIYIDYMLIFMNLISENPNSAYNSILLNNLDVFSICADLDECDPEDATYFRELVHSFTMLK